MKISTVHAGMYPIATATLRLLCAVSIGQSQGWGMQYIVPPTYTVLACTLRMG